MQSLHVKWSTNLFDTLAPTSAHNKACVHAVSINYWHFFSKNC
jgi:hypothetical protein